MIELAWGWLRHQPQSRVSRWFHEHTGKGGSRSRRKAIVAVARKLAILLHRLWVTGEVYVPIRPVEGAAIG